MPHIDRPTALPIVCPHCGQSAEVYFEADIGVFDLSIYAVGDLVIKTIPPDRKPWLRVTNRVPGWVGTPGGAIPDLPQRSVPIQGHVALPGHCER